MAISCLGQVEHGNDVSHDSEKVSFHLALPMPELHRQNKFIFAFQSGYCADLEDNCMVIFFLYRKWYILCTN